MRLKYFRLVSKMSQYSRAQINYVIAITQQVFIFHFFSDTHSTIQWLGGDKWPVEFVAFFSSNISSVPPSASRRKMSFNGYHRYSRNDNRDQGPLTALHIWPTHIIMNKSANIFSCWLVYPNSCPQLGGSGAGEWLRCPNDDGHNWGITEIPLAAYCFLFFALLRRNPLPLSYKVLALTWSGNLVLIFIEYRTNS